MRRRILTYGNYFADFMASLSAKEAEKVKYILSLLEREDRMPTKFLCKALFLATAKLEQVRLCSFGLSKKFIKLIRDGLYELRIAYNGNIYRVFFIFDAGYVVVLFSGFRKKTPKTPKSEIEKAMKIKSAYYEYKKQTDGF